MLAVPSRHRSLTLLGVMLGAQLLLLAIQIKRETQVRLIRIWAVELVSPLGRAAAWSSDAVGGTWSTTLRCATCASKTSRCRPSLTA